MFESLCVCVRVCVCVCAQESQVLLTLTNPVENVTHVTLVGCEEGDQDDINTTAKVT